jgi:hypothetical protein
VQLKIKRTATVQTVSVGTDTASSTSARFDEMAGGVVLVDGNTASATFTTWASSDGLTFAALAGADGAAATLTIPAGGAAVAMPDPAHAVRYIRLVSSVPLGTSVAVSVALKS